MTLEMHGSAGFDEFQRPSDVLSLSPLTVDILSRNILSQTQLQNNNKRKNNSYENGHEVKRQKRVEPLEIVGTPLVNPFPSGFMSSSAYSSFSESSQSLSPPLTPGSVSFPPYFPNYGLGQSQTHHQQQQAPATYFQYDMAQVSPRGLSGPLRGFPEQVLQPQVSPGARAQGKAVSAALSYLYEKSLSSVRRWRENGLTVQLFYCVVCGLPSDSEQRIKAHIENRHQSQHSDIEKADEGTRLECKACGKENSSQQGLSRHQEECQIYRPYRQDQSPHYIKHPQTGEGGCDHCAKTFLISARLKHHMQTCQASPNPSKLQCKVCTKLFTRKDQYLLHLPVHAFYL